MTKRRDEVAPSPPIPYANEDAELTSRALLKSFLVEQIERRSRASSALGFAQINYGRLFVRDRWTLFAIARELGCTVEELLAPVEHNREASVPWPDLVESSERVMGSVRSLSDPLRQVTLLRAAGLSWRKIGRLHPGRTSFSLADDFSDAVRRVWVLSARDVRFMATVEHPRLQVGKRSSQDGRSRVN